MIISDDGQTALRMCRNCYFLDSGKSSDVVENTARKGVQAWITDLDELKQRLRTELAKLDHVVDVAAIRQWRRR